MAQAHWKHTEKGILGKFSIAKQHFAQCHNAARLQNTKQLQCLQQGENWGSNETITNASVKGQKAWYVGGVASRLKIYSGIC